MNKIELNEVSVLYPVFENPKARSLKNALATRIIGGNIYEENSKNYIRALDNITLEIKSGDRYAITGPNGSGKSSFLRLVSGCMEPTHGYINSIGKISSLLNLSMGLDGDLTGVENIELRGGLYNFTKKEIKKFEEDVLEFSELEHFANIPVYQYSSGMSLRLAFGMSTYSAPEILIIDEIISVGDLDFEKKSKKRIEDLMNKTNILLLASHLKEIREDYCNKQINFNKGKIEIVKI
jgi:ABC-type polysaccharide/polyol phosphate transport system ATPase subunit